MQFAHSIYLIVGLAACTILGFGFYHFQKKGQTALQRFAAGHLLEKLTEGVSPGRRMTRRIMLIIAVASIFFALARPQVGFQWKEVKRKGIDILMAVDTSKSMLANDVNPNRLERSKLGIMDFVSKLEGDRVGLVPFAGTAFLMCPLTLDYDAFRQSLNALDTGIIPQGGTDIASAIREAESAFSNDANHKILILVTDGEDLEGEALNAAKEAAQKGLTIYTVGVGTPSGELIPLKRRGKGSFVKDDQGQLIKSRLDEKMLWNIAAATGGQYELLGQQAEGLDAIYKQKLSLVPKHELSERMQRVPVDRFEWPLLLAFILLVIEFAVSDRRPRRKRGPVIRTSDRRLLKGAKGVQAVSLALILLAFLVVSQKSYASPQSAEKAYNRGEYSLAAKEYKAAAKKAPDKAQLQFNLGAAAYKEKKYKEALAAFQTAIKVREVPLQNKAYYNMGNTLYRQGEETEKSKPQNSIKHWEKSIKAYEGALKLDPDDKDAHFNQEFVKKKLEALKKKQKQNKKQNNQSCKANNKKKDKNQDKNKGQNKTQGEQKKDQQKNKNQEKAKSRPDKKGQEKGDKDTAQAKAKENKKNKQDRSTAGSAAGQTKQAKSKEKAEKSTAKRAERRRRPGQMTEEQARNLLNSLKGEEKATPMVAGNRGKGKGRQDKKRRDW